MEEVDEEIVRRVLNGATNDFELLVRKYERVIFSTMYRFTRCELEAADLTQEIYLQAFSKLHTIKTGKKFFNWLYTITLNRGRDWVRSSRGSRLVREDQDSEIKTFRSTANNAGELQPEDNIQLQQEQERINNALLDLSMETRETLILRFKYDLSIREIAEMENISESGVKMRISRGLEQLQTMLSRQGY